MKKENEEKDTKIKDFEKKLSKFKDINVADVDPFEMHRKLRLYQSRLELSEIHNLKIEEKNKEINYVFQIMGITLEDLKNSLITGILDFSKGASQNTRAFEVSS